MLKSENFSILGGEVDSLVEEMTTEKTLNDKLWVILKSKYWHLYRVVKIYITGYYVLWTLQQMRLIVYFSYSGKQIIT